MLSFCTWFRHDCTFAVFTPGAGIWEPSRKSVMIISTNSSFRRRSGVRNALANALSTTSSFLAVRRRGADSREPASQAPESLTGAPRPAGCPCTDPWGSGYGDRTARGLDLLLGGGRERVGGDVDLDGDVALAEHLDRLALADRALGHELVDGDLATVGEERVDLVEVDDLELHAEGVLEALQLGQAHVQRELATLEGGRHLVARLCALGSTAGGLALGALTTTHAGL